MVSGTQRKPHHPERETPQAAELLEGGINWNPSRMLSLPNSITFCRIVAVPIFLTLVVYEQHRAALLLFIATAISDSLDGFVARTLHQRTILGGILDPLADKLLLTTAFIVIANQKLLPPWVAIAVVSRDVLMMIGWVVLTLASGKLEAGPSKIGKATAAVQFTIIIAVLAYSAPDAHPPLVFACAWLTAVLTVVSGIHYLYVGMRRLNAV